MEAVLNEQPQEAVASPSTNESNEVDQPQLTQEQPVKSERAALYEYLNQPDVQNNLVTSARNLETRFRGNSFTIEQVMKKTNVKSAYNAQQLLNMLSLSGMLTTITIGRIQKYKITIPVAKRIATLQKQVDEMDEQRRLIVEQIDALKTQLPEQLKAAA